MNEHNEIPNYQDELLQLNELLERLNQAGYKALGSININIYKPGSQHVDRVETQYIGASPPTQASPPTPLAGERGVDSSEKTKGLPEVLATEEAMRLWEKARQGEGECLRQKRGEEVEERIRQCIAMLMQEGYGKEALFNQQSHWQAVYRILVDKGYCRDSDFDGFDMFIRTVMPEEVNKPYSKGSVKQISQTDFVRPFEEWKYDALTSKTRKPFERMVAVASRFKSILEENRL